MRARSNFFPPTRCAAAAAAASREKWAATKSWLSGATEAHRPMVERARTRSFFQQSCFIFRQITATADVLECCCCCCFGDDGGGEISSWRQKSWVTGFFLQTPPAFFVHLSLSLSLFLRFELFQSEEKRGDDEEKKDKREEWCEWVSGWARRSIEKEKVKRKTLPTSTTYCRLTTPLSSGWLLAQR